jgi:ParB family chromosome partitioning protein
MNNNINSMDKEIMEISLDEILPNRFQPRLSFDQNALNELATSIKQHGIIQPLVVRRLGDKYEIIAGERRYKAAAIAGLKTVPVVVMNLNDNESAEIAIVENIQRKEMTALEEAKSFKKILDKGYLTQEQLAVRMGKSQSAIANKLRLLNLSEEVQDALQNEKISERHARSLLGIKSVEDQKNMLNEIINNKLTVKQTDELIKQKYGVTDTTTEEDGTLGQIKNFQAYASAAPFIPNPYAENEPNPQLNLINKLNGVQQNVPSTNVNQMEPSNPFDVTPVEAAPPEAFKISNPTPEPQEVINIDQPIDIDVNKLKEEARDINKSNIEPADISGLLKPDIITVPKEAPINSEEKKNRFIFDFEPEALKEPTSPSDIEVLDMGEAIPKKEEEIKIEASTVQSAIDTIKSNIEKLKNSGFKVTSEEFDFEKLYQIIIKIDK